MEDFQFDKKKWTKARISYIRKLCLRSSMDRILVSGTNDGGSNPFGDTFKIFLVQIANVIAPRDL